MQIQIRMALIMAFMFVVMTNCLRSYRDRESLACDFPVLTFLLARCSQGKHQPLPLFSITAAPFQLSLPYTLAMLPAFVFLLSSDQISVILVPIFEWSLKCFVTVENAHMSFFFFLYHDTPTPLALPVCLVLARLSKFAKQTVSQSESSRLKKKK